MKGERRVMRRKGEGEIVDGGGVEVRYVSCLERKRL